MKGSTAVQGGLIGSRVLVVVGTDHHPFERLSRWMDRWLEEPPVVGVHCVFQYGAGPPPRLAQTYATLDHAKLMELLRHADAVVTHGGPTSISEARRMGHRPIVVPRSPRLGEHVDDHQIRFAHHLAQSDMVDVAGSFADMASQLKHRLGEHGQPLRVSRPAEDTASAAHRFGQVVDDILRSRS